MKQAGLVKKVLSCEAMTTSTNIIHLKKSLVQVFEPRKLLGSLSEVWTVKHKKGGQIRAVKIVKKSLNKGMKVIESLVNSEIDSLAKLDSPNIEKIYEVFEDKYKYYIVTEVLKGPTLIKSIEKLGKKTLNEKVIACYVKDILSGLSHCHAMNILHRDLRPENVIFANNKQSCLKLIDFKFAKVFDESQKSQTILGAPAYIAPEVLSKRSYTPKADIWSCGIITYLLLSGNLPYVVTTKMPVSELFSIIQANKFTMESLKGNTWDKVSTEGKSFLLKMLETDVDSRASAEELLKDGWLENSNEAPINDETAKIYLSNMRNTLVLFI